ncbi:MAG: cob(I)yrinic acid a,c-diamide adenosyltransferase [Candidatus Thiodiazotropha sp. (ex Epidulcina cf. delphinae)]|nr:cob(I)yrinic acid a,c-diamide adenosyltransferase [Candidatus Thiodiazotropha sp. (ex Epidulcina cf. delphinae)]
MKQRENRQGITLVLTGEGKGKSSSAFGTAFRAAGWQLQVVVIQFIKGKWKTGEQQAASRFDNIEWHALGDGFTWNTQNPEQDLQTSREIWAFCQEKIRSHRYDLVVLDEINYCCEYGWLSGEEIADFIQREKPSWMHLILTGRGAPIELIEIADTVTEMKKIKHAFDLGIQAEQGLEF